MSLILPCESPFLRVALFFAAACPFIGIAAPLARFLDRAPPYDFGVDAGNIIDVGDFRPKSVAPPHWPRQRQKWRKGLISDSSTRAADLERLMVDDADKDTILWANLKDIKGKDTSAYWDALCKSTNVSKANVMPGDVQPKRNVTEITANATLAKKTAAPKQPKVPKELPRKPVESDFWRSFCEYRKKGKLLRIMFEGNNCVASSVKDLGTAANPVECADLVAKDAGCTDVFDFRFGPPTSCRCLKKGEDCSPALAPDGSVYARSQ